MKVKSSRIERLRERKNPFFAPKNGKSNLSLELFLDRNKIKRGPVKKFLTHMLFFSLKTFCKLVITFVEILNCSKDTNI